MKHIPTGKTRGGFDVLVATRNIQAAMMILQPGGTSDDEPDNDHPNSEQWVFVIEGSGVAKVGKKRSALKSVQLRTNSLLLIEKGELHQIRNNTRKPLRTLNFYLPPAYDSKGALK